MNNLDITAHNIAFHAIASTAANRNFRMEQSFTHELVIANPSAAHAAIEKLKSCPDTYAGDGSFIGANPLKAIELIQTDLRKLQ